MKVGKKRIHKSFSWQHRFNGLIQERERCGFTLEKMASMIEAMSLADPDVYVAVTEQELREVEDDPMHGMSAAAMMYVRFMGCISTISGSPGSKATYEIPIEGFAEKKVSKSVVQNEAADAIRLLLSGDLVAMSASVNTADRNGEGVCISVKAMYLTDEEVCEIGQILMRSVERRATLGKNGYKILADKIRVFKSVRRKRREAKRRVREAMQEKVEPNSDEGA